jgi:hypothetical protein
MKRITSQSGRAMKVQRANRLEHPDNTDNDDDFQPYRHAHRLLPRKAFDAETPYASFIRHAYSGGRSLYACELCNVDLTPANEFDSMSDTLHDHCSSTRHRIRALQVHTLQQSNMRVWCAKLQCRMDDLADGPWKKDVQNCLGWTLLNYQAWKVTGRQYQGPMREAEETIEEYECQARVHILDLAVWKALCQMSIDSGKMKTNMDFHAWLDWKRSGWNKVKREMRDSNELDIIVTSVLPFLDQETTDSEKEIEFGMAGFSDDEDCDREKRLPSIACCLFDAPAHSHRVLTPSLTARESVHQVSVIRHVYSGQKVTFRCEVCELDLPRRNDVDRHCCGADHRNRIEQIRNLQKCPTRIWCANIESRLGCCCEPWQTEIRCKLFWILLQCDAWSVVPDSTELERRKQEVEQLLDKQEQNAQSTLVHLAAWKSLCMLNPPSQYMASGGNWEHWMIQGWKGRKSATHNSGEIQAIVKCVMPFVTDTAYE